MALHTLKYYLHTLYKCPEYQVDNMLVYAVYAKTNKNIIVNRFNIC